MRAIFSKIMNEYFGEVKMIEKIMKAVKRGNKKRSINITVGAVVGFLLSCTAVMGANEYLWIKNDGGIKFSTDNSTPVSTGNPYKENTWDGTDYVNNITLNSASTDYGLKLSGDLSGINFTNNGLIAVTGNNLTCGISNEGTIGDITNTGLITGTSTGNSYGNEGNGIYNNGTMGNITNRGLIIGANTGIGTVSRDGYGIYNGYSGTINGNIINDGTIIGNYGIYNSGTINGTVTNNGLILADENRKFGIYSHGTITAILNNGLIKGEENGICNNNEIRQNIINNGSMVGGQGGINYYGTTPIINSGLLKGVLKDQERNDYFSGGIYGNGRVPKLLNIGSMLGIAIRGVSQGAGIYNVTSGKIGSIINMGSITGTSTGSGDGYGIYNGIKTDFSYDKTEIKAIKNTGVIYGDTNAIITFSLYSSTESNAIITSLDNYGILATKGNLVINDTNGTITNPPTNYGLHIKDTDGKVILGSILSGPTDIIVDYDDGGNEIKRNMTIKNAELEGASGSATETKSITFSGAENYNDHIVNGKDKTITASGSGEILGSIINAYGTAVAFDGTDSQLTLSGTIVNGGSDGTNNSITGSTNGDTLILQSGDITYVGSGSPASQNTVINGNIDMADGIDTITVDTGAIINGSVKMGAGDDVLNIVSGGKINGTLDGGTGDDTLNFNPKTTRALGNSEINIQHNISDFETININTNVTLFEKTIEDDGSIEKLSISEVNEINISAGSVLNLRIDTTETNGRYEGHALFGNTALTINGDAGSLGEGESITESENGIYNVGVLNLVTNGLGKNSIIAMDGITLDEDLFTKTNSILDKAVVLKTDEGSGKAGDIRVEADKDIFREVKTSSQKYEKLNDIYNGVISSTDDNFIALKNIITINNKTEDYTSVTDSEQLAKLLDYLGDIYTGSPYSYSSELSRRSVGMFRDIVTENEFKPELNKWMIMGGLTHADGGTKDTYYGRNYHGFDTGTSNTKADMKLTGAYMLAKYGYSENLSLGLTLGGNKSEAEMSMSKVKANSGYIGAFAEKYRGNLTLKAGAGIQYSEYDADRRTVGENYSEKYSDMTYDIYLNGRYSHNIGENLFLEPYGTLSYTYIDQDGANEGGKTLAIETDSKSFDYTTAKVGVDLKKVIPHEKGKSTLSAGISYTKILDGADEEHITGRFKGGSDFDILVAHKNEHSIGLNAKYALELENGVIFDIKGTYSVERDSHNGSGKNKTKGEWIVGTGLGYKF